jgi:aryl-alcohol dehydrogenase-like predicted oxidoreductase
MSHPDMVRHPLFDNIELGIGTWSWGDRFFWGYGNGYGDEDIKAAFTECLTYGVNFFDTAETYGQGRSERIIGNLTASAIQPIKIATKFMPFPWRLTRSELLRALKKSLERLQRPSIDLYQVHWPWPPITIETWMNGMVDAVHKGWIGAVGVSNYDRKQVQTAYDTLIRNGIQLASNQVEYNLLNRKIEANGIFDLCKSLGITIIAYSPLAMGILTGKYTVNSLPPGMRGRRYNNKVLHQIEPLLSTLKYIGEEHGGKSVSQVALNWVICKGAIPIPGAKNAQQAHQNIGAAGWRLTEDDIAKLDLMSALIMEQN